MIPNSWDELLTGENNRKKTYLHDKFSPLIGATIGFARACFLNFGTRRPLFSGIQKHFILTGVGAISGKAIDTWKNEQLAEKDAAIRHYIQLHREDFPLPERKKIGDLFDEWLPVR